MAVSKIKAEFECDVQTIWNIVTSLEVYSWRSDISQIKVIDDKTFMEYTKDGYATKFIVTVFDMYKRYEFDMENENMKGHWTGIFTSQKGKTSIEFIEDVIAKKLIMKPFVKTYLKKQQQKYINDLTQAIINV